MDGGPLGTAEEILARERYPAVAEYYARTVEDYRRWSPGLHMHFGYWRWPLSPFAREAMIDALCEAVHARLDLAPGVAGTVLDLGCGVGSAARQLALRHRGIDVLGLTVAPAQVELGNALCARAGLEHRVRLIEADYAEVPRPAAAAVAAYAIESACYDPDDGASLIREAARVLEPGARLVIADGFRRRELPRAAERFERGMAAGWVLPRLPSSRGMIEQLRRHGFAEIEVEDASARVLPSALHIPLVALVHRLREGAGLEDSPRRGHLRASLWCLASVLIWPRRFGYYIISARAGRATGARADRL